MGTSGTPGVRGVIKGPSGIELPVLGWPAGVQEGS